VQLVVGYNFDGDLHGDDTNGLGAHWLAFADEASIIEAICLANVFNGISGVRNPLFLSASSPGAASRTYVFDLDYLTP
jgi:hypothetical protein